MAKLDDKSEIRQCKCSWRDYNKITHNYYCTLWVSLDKAISTVYLAQSEALPLHQGHTSLI